MKTIKEAIEGLKLGKTLLYPTDTIWGLGCAVSHEVAIQQIKELKKRSPNKSFIILVDAIPMLERYVPKINSACYDLLEYADNPLTIIYDNPIDLPKSLLADDGSIGIRVTKDPICQQLIRGIRQPIVSTSANLSGGKTATCFAEIDETIKTNVDMILNERLTEIRSFPSKIIKIKENGTIQLIR